MKKNKNRKQPSAAAADDKTGSSLNTLITEAKKVAPDVSQEQVLKIANIATQYQGPIPPPAMLAQYTGVIKDGAERIFLIFEKQTTHRIDLEKKIVKHDIIQSYFGIAIAFIITMTIIIGGIFLIFNDKQISGFGTLFTGLAALVGSFIYGRKALNKQAMEN